MWAERTSHISLSGIREMFALTKPNAINLGLGQPDFDTPVHIKEAAKEALDAGFTGYTPNKGFPELIDAIARYYEQYGIHASQEQIICTSGGSEALHLAFEALVNSGDEVIIPDPGFVAYSPLTRVAGGIPVSARIKADDDFRLQPSTVADCITNKTKVLVINSPANPTGAVQRYDELRGFVELANDYDFYIISDEVYDKILYAGERISAGSMDSDRVIVVNSVSKTYAMTGWRLGYAIAPETIVEEMLKVHQYIQACAPSISQKAAYTALNGSQESVKSMVEEFRTRRNAVMQHLKEIAECVTPEGAFYVFPRFFTSDTSLGLTKKLAQEGVIVVAGSAFGRFGEGHIRISYAASQQAIDRAFQIIKKQILM
ncbi:MAG: pyridoxal phosphate-dependent aminotransferase [Euryarchaeota archaeon]|nr:pyridoxal phosphate-dependent aminotransferase [Euryarchaeota archaeon]